MPIPILDFLCGSPSCLENPMEREAWQATVHGAAESDTTEQLSLTPLIDSTRQCKTQESMHISPSCTRLLQQSASLEQALEIAVKQTAVPPPKGASCLPAPSFTPGTRSFLFSNSLKPPFTYAIAHYQGDDCSTAAFPCRCSLCLFHVVTKCCSHWDYSWKESRIHLIEVKLNRPCTSGIGIPHVHNHKC